MIGVDELSTELSIFQGSLVLILTSTLNQTATMYINPYMHSLSGYYTNTIKWALLLTHFTCGKTESLMRLSKRVRVTGLVSGRAGTPRCMLFSALLHCLLFPFSAPVPSAGFLLTEHQLELQHFQ